MSTRTELWTRAADDLADAVESRDLTPTEAQAAAAIIRAVVRVRAERAAMMLRPSSQSHPSAVARCLIGAAHVEALREDLRRTRDRGTEVAP